MAKKGSVNSSHGALPVEDYRRKIGKQEIKKNRKEIKEQKRQAEVKKSSRGFTDMVLMLGAFVAVVAGVYFVLYMYLQEGVSPEKLDQ